MTQHAPRPPLPRRLFAAAAVVLACLAPVLAAASAPVPSPDEPRFSWPLFPPPAVTRPFEPPPDPYAAGHRGVDLAATPGQQVLAPADGVVVFAGPLAGRGVLSIDHEGGLRTTYEPVADPIPAGTRVRRAQPTATVTAGHPGCPAPACLHWGLRRGEEYLNPLDLLPRPPARLRLKPWINPEDTT